MTRKVNETQLAILQTGTRMFLEWGYSATSPKAICAAVGISPGTLTHYYPTKEQLLAVLIEMLADFQWKTVVDIVNEGETPLTALCLEVAAMASIVREDDIACDLYISAYTNALSLGIIRRHDAMRAKQVFATYCEGWTDESFAAAETMVSGIEYATLRLTPDSPPLEVCVTQAMNAILGLYGVPEDLRQKTIREALAMDYHSFGRKMLEGFKQYVLEMTETVFAEMAV